MKLKKVTLGILLSVSILVPLNILQEAKADNHKKEKIIENGTKITWYGHAAFKIVTPNNKIIFIDPWITNPLNEEGRSNLKDITKADYILVTHGHSDHIGNAVEIAKKTKAKLVATYDLGNAIVQNTGFPKKQSTMMTQGNFGGTVNLENNEIKVTFVPAVHSSGISSKDGKETKYAGNPGGFLIQIKNGPTIYHTGDTDLFQDMALIPKINHVDIMLSTIGDHFVMSPKAASHAVKLVNPTKVIPMHYGTFPLLSGNPDDFKKHLAKYNLENKLMSMKVNQTITY